MARIAIISDLHVGAVARSSDLNPFSQPPAATDGFLDSFEAFVRTNGISADALIVPGDISDKAHPAEYELATTVIQRVATMLGVDHGAVFPVLGNHDLNWALVSAIADAPEFGREMRFATVERSGWLHQRLTSSGGRSQTQLPYLCVDETENMYLVRYNSAESDLPAVRPHRGAIQQAHIDALRQLLSDFPPVGDKVRVFLTHHHPTIYSDPIPDLPDFSALVNAEGMLDALRDHRFDFVIHGHKHSPRFSSAVLAGRHALSILCAGSFSRQIDTAWTGKITNQFHLINCAGRASGTGYLKGEVLSWAYQPRAWIPSNRQWAGIQHRLPFGWYPSEPELSSQIRAALNAPLASRAAIWPDLTSAIPEIEFADASLVDRVLSQFADDTASILRFNPDKPQDLAMVRK